MAGPHTQFSLFDLPASPEGPQEASPAPAQEPAGALQPEASQPAPEAPGVVPQPESPAPQAGIIGYFEEDAADIPTLPQQETMVTEPEPPHQSPEPLPEPVPGMQQSQPAAQPEPASLDEAEPAFEAGPEPTIEPSTEIDELQETPVAEPDQYPTTANSSLVAFEDPGTNTDAADIIVPQALPDAENIPGATAPDVTPAGELQAAIPAPEPRPSRPILAFDIEPMGAAAPEDIPREFLSGRLIAGQPKPKSTRGRKSTKATEAGPDKILVPEDEELFKRQYYPISEVATMFGVNISQIRYWENEFPQLKPRKNGKGDRLFRPEDIKTLVLIHDLIRRRKYTLEGAKEFLKVNNGEDIRFPLIQQLQKLKGFLNELKANM